MLKKTVQVHQADFWFLPTFGESFPLQNSIWHMDMLCDKYNHWGGEGGEWRLGLEERLKKMDDAVGVRLGWQESMPRFTCVGNADFYYISQESWRKFGEIVQKVWLYMPKESSYFGQLNANEVAVPFTMRALRDSATIVSSSLRKDRQAATIQDISICWKALSYESYSFEVSP